MDAFKANVNSILLNPQYSKSLALIKGARNGAVYGAKVRFPHALVMVMLFRSGSLRSKLALVLKATRQHARNLATFALVYKAMVALLLRASPTKKEESWHTFLAGLVGGYYVFGRGIQSSVNQQIVIYIFARVALGAAKLAVQNRSEGGWGLLGYKDRQTVKVNAWPVFASLSWASVMWLFRYHPEVLQPSLKSSMQYM
ncbi:uncharacterized protein KY384_004222 [Bacidia gigantensis]|uniref:uncharacterized protein n=1 Tax=Bacidia gigantensis TaxID=2732470 RepID=UPI001D04E178|nr:uncharacterized protein KY384_004222 [Bacidia gigantensis]KAG8530865.1 hypothetical protein KY384_004222 [Bacidia gigantensis]